MPGLSRALEGGPHPRLQKVCRFQVPAQGSKVAFGRLLLPPVTKKGRFFATLSGPKKTRKTRDANTGLPSSRWRLEISAVDAASVKVASSLRFCAHGSLQSFSTSDKIKGPKTDPPGRTTPWGPV